MTRDDLTALIARVEAATGPDREVDAEIARTLLPHNAEHVARSRSGWSYRVFGPEGWDDEWMETRPYTASLDAAMTLVPEGGEWNAAGGWTSGCLPSSRAKAVKATAWVWGAERGVFAATPALALTAAALRARLAQIRDDA